MEIVSPWMLYWWTRLDVVHGPGVKIFCSLCFLVAAALCVLTAITWANDDLEAVPKGLKKAVKWTFIVCTVTFLSTCTARCVLPTKQDAAMIYVIPKLANSKVIQEEAGEVYKMAKDALRAGLPKD